MSVSQRELKENTFKLPKAWETRATKSKIDFSFKSKWSREWHEFTGTIKKGSKARHYNTKLLSIVNWKLLYNKFSLTTQ